MSHPLHIKVGELLRTWCHKPSLILDSACGGEQHIPLFLVPTRRNANEICNVDALVLHGGCVRLVIEIDESNIKPTQVCGKFLTSALARWYIHDSSRAEPMPLQDVSFVQVLSSAKLAKKKTSKLQQTKSIEERLCELCCTAEMSVRRYAVIWDLDKKDKIEKLHQIVANVQQAT